jgi:hypothetical protein
VLCFLVGSVLLILLVVCCVFGRIRVAHLCSGVLCFWWDPCCSSF